MFLNFYFFFFFLFFFFFFLPSHFSPTGHWTGQRPPRQPLASHIGNWARLTLASNGEGEPCHGWARPPSPMVDEGEPHRPLAVGRSMDRRLAGGRREGRGKKFNKILKIKIVYHIFKKLLIRISPS